MSWHLRFKFIELTYPVPAGVCTDIKVVRLSKCILNQTWDSRIFNLYFAV